MYQDGAAGKCSTILGYWRQSAAGRGSMDVEHKRKHGSLLPWPVALGEKWDGQDEFCAEVELLCSIVKTPTRFMGFSRCRICQQPNGSREYRGNDYCITEGYLHLVRDHNVQPTDKERQSVSDLFEKSTAAQLSKQVSSNPAKSALQLQ